MVRFEPDLGVCEAEVRETGSYVCLIAYAVPGLLGGGAVIAQAVGFHHEAQVRPVEVDLEPADVLPCLGAGKPGYAGNRQKTTF